MVRLWDQVMMLNVICSCDDSIDILSLLITRLIVRTFEMSNSQKFLIG